METYDNNNASLELRTALQAARAAADISRSYYAGNFTVTTKADMTPVTQADVECEQKIREIILEQFPEHGFYGEETGRTREDADYLYWSTLSTVPRDLCASTRSFPPRLR